jgi:hypothetical protein
MTSTSIFTIVPGDSSHTVVFAVAVDRYDRDSRLTFHSVTYRTRRTAATERPRIAKETMLHSKQRQMPSAGVGTRNRLRQDQRLLHRRRRPTRGISANPTALHGMSSEAPSIELGAFPLSRIPVTRRQKPWRQTSLGAQCPADACAVDPPTPSTTSSAATRHHDNLVIATAPDR